MEVIFKNECNDCIVLFLRQLIKYTFDKLEVILFEYTYYDYYYYVCV